MDGRYMNESEVLRRDNPFVQLISGACWLVRNGQPYVSQSIFYEGSMNDVLSLKTSYFRLDISDPCAGQFPATYETGAKFTSSISARTAIGHDANGAVKIVQFDGISYETGYADV